MPASEYGERIESECESESEEKNRVRADVSASLSHPLSPCFSSGDRTRTCDLWVMSPTSYQLLHPAI